MRPPLGTEPRTVALLGNSSATRIDVLRGALPATWLVEGESHLAHADYLVVCEATLDAAVLAACGRLRRVIRLEDAGGAVDEGACAERGIPVEVVESSTSISVAEHAVMSMMILFKRVLRATAELRERKLRNGVVPVVATQQLYAYNWTDLGQWETLSGKSIGLVGLGEIGRHVARLLRGFGADVIYTKPNRLGPTEEKELGVRYESLDGLLASSRCVSLHNRLSVPPGITIGARELALMPRGSFLVNTARGALVDEDALVGALRECHLAGAALDVFRVEPLPDDSPLLSLPNLLLTPHIAGIPNAEAELLELQTAASLLTADVP